MRIIRHKVLLLFFLAIVTFRVTAQDTASDNRIYMVVQQMPVFPGDIDNYLADHIQYPQSAIDRHIEGIVYVTFIINKTGDISEVTVLSGLNPDIDSEAVRVVRSMPPWNPGIMNGKPVRVQYNLKVPFLLNGSRRQQPGIEPHEYYNYRDTVFILRDGLYFDPFIGFGISGPQSSSSASISNTVSFKGGLGVSYMLPSGIGISTGIGIQQNGFSYSPSSSLNPALFDDLPTKYRTSSNDTTVTTGFNSNVTYSFLYLQVPLFGRFISSSEDKIGFYAEAGIQFNYLLSSKITGSVTQSQYKLEQNPNSNFYVLGTPESGNSEPINTNAMDASKTTLSSHLAAGILFPLSSGISLILDVSAENGITNAGDGKKDVATLGSSQYYYYGTGNYGTFNSYMLEAKLLLKLSGSSEHVAR